MKKIFGLLVVGLAMFAVSCGPNAEKIEAQRIADSIKVADSLAKIEFVADSIATVDSIATADSIAKLTPAPVKK